MKKEEEEELNPNFLMRCFSHRYVATKLGVNCIRCGAAITRRGVPNPMPLVRKQHEHTTGDSSDGRRQHLEQNILNGLMRRIKTTNGVSIQQRHRSKHHHTEVSMHEVPKTQFITRQIDFVCARRWPQTLLGGDSVMGQSVTAFVAIGEAGKGTREGADREEHDGRELVTGVAVAVVGYYRTEELEEEDGAGREVLDEVANAA